MNNQQTVICLKQGTRYGPEHVNRFYSMVKRHTVRPLRFVCITDDTAGLISAVETLLMPEFDLPEPFRFKGFRCIFLFSRQRKAVCKCTQTDLFQ